MKRLVLDGNDWEVTGLWRNQTEFVRAYSDRIIDTGLPAVLPIKAEVPGNINKDLMKAGIVPDYNIDLNSIYGEWVEHREWVYRKCFSVPENLKGYSNILCFEGLDYEGEIILNDKVLYCFKGMFKPVEIDVTNFLRYGGINTLEVLFYPAPEIDGMYGYSSRLTHLKSRFNYLWDWCVRIVPVGIWDHVYIKSFKKVCFSDIYTRTALDERNGILELFLDMICNTEGEFEISIKLFYESGNNIVLEKHQVVDFHKGINNFKRIFNISGVKPWWPNGYGEQHLYTLKISIIFTDDGSVCCEDVRTIGFRNIEFTKNPCSHEDAPPYTLIFNGKRVFIKGVNWVPISPLYGTVNEEEYYKYLKKIKDMNCNLVRVWGGGIIEKEEFYRVCDNLGIMVWQELLQSSSAIENMPPNDPVFLEELEETVAYAIKRRRHHVSHIIWCGGNELTETEERGIPATQNNVNLKMLEKVVKELDPGKRFLPCSPFGPEFFGDDKKYGMGICYDVHGRWNYMDDHYDYYDRDDSLFRSEVGTPAASSVETILEVSHRLNPWPPNQKNALWLHHGSGWIQWEQLNELFGKWDENNNELESYVNSSQLLQYEALRYATEAVRRREPHAGGVIVWMGNEPFANTANTSLIEYNGRSKPAYYAVSKTYSHLNVSCKYSSICYKQGNEFSGEVYIHSEEKIEGPVRVLCEIKDVKGKILKRKIIEVSTIGIPVQKVGDIRWTIEGLSNHIFFLKLDLISNEAILAENIYFYTIDIKNPFKPFRMMDKAILDCSIFSEDTEKVRIKLRNVSEVVALMVIVENKNNPFHNIFPNGFVIFPGETKTVEYGCCNPGSMLMVRGYNVEKMELYM